MADRDVSLIEPFLRELWQRQGSDLLISVGTPPLLRIDGSLIPVAGIKALTEDETKRIVLHLLGPEQSERFLHTKEVDFSFGWGGVARFRANAFHQRGTIALALRMIPNEIPTFEQLGLPPVIDDLARQHQGLILVTGPTGSGKSTTLASVVDVINSRRACHILTIEDPIEYQHDHKRSAVSQREVGIDTESFASALRAALREDPDVLLVGEMRDPETIQTALTIAETGHLVFATLHTNDAAQTLDRIIDVFPGDEQPQVRTQLAGSLRAIISQRLVPKVPSGRMAAFEVLVTTHAVRNLIRDRKTEQIRNIITTNQKLGMQTLEDSLNDLVRRQLVDYEDAVAVSQYPREISQEGIALPVGTG